MTDVARQAEPHAGAVAWNRVALSYAFEAWLLTEGKLNAPRSAVLEDSA